MRPMVLLLLALVLDSPAVLADAQDADLVARRLADRAPRWRCPVRVRYICSSRGCEVGAGAATWLVLDFAQGRYQRCDGQGCDTYPLRHAAAGIYTTASPGMHRGTVLKLVNDGSEFAEAASLGTTLVNSFGSCAPEAP
jgi:hypothetical protein